MAGEPTHTDESFGPRDVIEGRSALVTGASGFIGACLSSALLDRHARVQGVGRVPRCWADLRIEWHYGDLGSETFVEELFERSLPDTVFHLASYVSGSRDLQAVLSTLTNGLVAAVHVLRESTRCECRRVVLAGSMEEPDPADQTLYPTSPHAAA